ncbi:hypothetical protein Tco_0764827 [Tanacetum coccineum]
MPHDVPSTSDRRLIELENQVQRLMEAHLAPKQHVQVNKITSSCEICSGPQDIRTAWKSLEANPSSPKRVHFINFVIILRKEDEVREEENVKRNETEYNDHEMTAKAEEKVEEESEEEFKEENKDETKEEEEDDPEYFDTFPTMEELGYHKWLLKNPRPPWIKANISIGDLNNEDTTSVIDHYLGSVVLNKLLWK